MSQTATLSANQLSAIEKLRTYKVGALFMEPGTGKTRAAYELVKSVSGIDYILWLTPFQTKSNLLTEINKCGGLNNLEIVGIETISSSDRTYLDLINKVQSRNTFIVCDESLKIKNWGAKRTKRIIELSKHCEYKLILNGTPATKNLLDLWAQLQFLSPLILKMELAEFENTFCEWTKITKSFGNQSIQKKFITAYHNIDHLYSLINHYVYNCDLDLQVKQDYSNASYDIEEDLLKDYYRLKEKYLDKETLQFMNNNIFLEMTQKMQHSYCCTDNKFVILENILKQYNPDNIIMFTKYIASREELQKRYPKLTVLSYGMHSFGLNLQDKFITIYFDKTFDYAQRTQSGYRTYRMGQIKDCKYYDFTGNVGLEKIIDDNIKKKISMSEYFKSKSIQEIKKEL